MSNISLMSILNGDSTGDPRIAKKILKVKQDKENILKAASKINENFKEEISKGDKTKQLLLEDGKRKGIKEEEIFSNNLVFIPTSSSPVLNFCYYITRSVDQSLSVLKESYDKKYGQLEHDPESSASGDIIPDLGKYLFENVTLETFSKIKKLKSMSRSENDQEAFIAFKKFNELCKKYNLDPTKIPDTNTNRDDVY